MESSFSEIYFEKKNEISKLMKEFICKRKVLEKYFLLH